MKKKSSLSTVTLAVLTLILGYAGVNTAHADLSLISNQIIHGVTFTTDKSAGSYDIQFTINSGSMPSNSFKYGIELVPLNGQSPDFTTIADEKVYDQTLNLGAGKSVNEDVVYTPPALNGAYRMIVETKNSSGLPLASALVTDVTLNASQTQKSGILIDPTSCFLTVGSDATKYNLIQGVDILPTESLYLSCTASNISKTSPIDGTVNFITDKRNTFGDTIANVPQTSQNIQLGAGENKSFKTVLPKPSTPQAYDTIVTLGNDGMTNSNPIIAHWVLQGDSATIQNVSLDKSTYNLGDKVNVSFAWTGSAGSFAGARSATTSTSTQTKLYTANLQICDNSQSINLDSNTGNDQAQLAIPASCNDPSLTINILSGTTNLATWNMSVPISTNSASTQSGNVISNLISLIKSNAIPVIIILLLIILLIIFVYMKKVGLITALLLVSGISLLGGHTASAQGVKTYNLMTNSLDKSAVYYCTQNSSFLTGAMNNTINQQTVFDGGQTLPIIQQPAVVSRTINWFGQQSSGTSGSCVTVTNNQNGNNPASYSSNGVDSVGNIMLQNNIGRRSSINATGTPVTFKEFSQFSVVNNTGISSFESQSDANIKSSPSTTVGSLLTSDPATTATLTIPKIPLLNGSVFPFNSYYFVGRTLLYNGNTLVAKSPWTSTNLWIKPPAGGIVELNGGSGTLQMTDPTNGALYAFSFAMTGQGPSYNPSTSFNPGETIYLQNLQVDYVLVCTNGKRDNLTMSYQVHPQSVALDANGTWTAVSGGNGYLPTVNSPTSPLPPGSYYMDIKITNRINFYHEYNDNYYQDGIVRIPFTIKYYQATENNLVASPDACALNSTATDPVGATLTWDNSINQTSPFNGYIGQGYNMGYNVKRLKYGDTLASTVTSLAPNQTFASSTNQSYTFDDTGLSQSTTYQYWMEWVLSKSGHPTITLQDPSSVYAVTDQCGDPNIQQNSCNISSNTSGPQSPGTPAILTWSSNGYDTCKINNSNASSSGSMTVNPITTTNYILDCSVATSQNHCISNKLIDVTAAATNNSVINLSDTVTLKCGAYDQSNNLITSANQNQMVTWKIINSTGNLAAMADRWTFTGSGASTNSTTTSEPTMSFSTTGVKNATANTVDGGTCNTSIIIDKTVLKEI